ncbi:MAG: hypothetical protein AB7O24_20275 [Kofleriaceae bacterium]
MTSAELIRWSSLHERRSRTGGWLGAPVAIAAIAGAALAAWVGWRTGAGVESASHAWLAGALAAFGLAFLRVPFLIYWRSDAGFLATLPLDGPALFDSAVWRCIRAAGATLLAVTIAAAPLARVSLELVVRHVALGVVLATVAALLMPAIVIGTASWVALDEGAHAMGAIRAATAAAGSSAQIANRGSASALLGAVPGLAAAVLIVLLIVASPWLYGHRASLPAGVLFAVIAIGGVAALVAARARIARMMPAILRDVSALDRQRLATLEIHPPTAIERGIAAVIGEAALPYSKDARLMRRRYPMAFALGALMFLVLVILAFSRPPDPVPWFTAVLTGATLYGIALAGRLQRPPIELGRLSRTLPISAAAFGRAKVAWLCGWWTIFVAAPALFSAARQAQPMPGLALLGGGTLTVIIAAFIRR